MHFDGSSPRALVANAIDRQRQLVGDAAVIDAKRAMLAPLAPMPRDNADANALLAAETTAATQLHDSNHRASCFKSTNGERCKCRYHSPLASNPGDTHVVEVSCIDRSATSSSTSTAWRLAHCCWAHRNIKAASTLSQLILFKPFRAFHALDKDDSK
jgi:hypothetical protein